MAAIVALDIGGANIKASDGEHLSLSVPFPLWREPKSLANQLRAVVSRFPSASQICVTMTGELADCFQTKAEGVARILKAVRAAVPAGDVRVWQTGGEFLTLEEAPDYPLLVAAANWHALATWAARFDPDRLGLLIDIGSTTSDIIPLVQGCPASTGLTDLERLVSQELVYRGVRRTPVAAVTSAFPWPLDASLVTRWVAPAAELFATTLDAYLLLGEIPEDDLDHGTADGRPATATAAHNRLAHQLCSDVTEISLDQARALAGHVAQAVEETIQAAVRHVVSGMPGPPAYILLSGEGEFVGRRVLHREADRLGCVELLSIGERLGTGHSQAACAFALARLGQEVW